MRSLVFWVAGMALAFLATAGAFLLLARLGSNLPGRDLPSGPQPEGSGPSLVLNVGEEQLRELERKPDQPLTVGVRNESEGLLEDISVTLRVAPEDTSSPQVRFYQATVERLPAGEYATIRFDLDLSSAGQPSQGSEPPRNIVEVRAVTPGGLSAVRTAILPS